MRSVMREKAHESKPPMAHLRQVRADQISPISKLRRVSARTILLQPRCQFATLAKRPRQRSVWRRCSGPLRGQSGAFHAQHIELALNIGEGDPNSEIAPGWPDSEHFRPATGT
jgi:hypothetical protein